MNTTILERLANLRAYMKECQIDACIVPTDDDHQSEYVSDYYKYRTYLSGFTGSCGTLVVAANQAGLWTDSRYFLQAEMQLKGSGIDLFKMRTPGFPTMKEWLLSQHFKAVGFDGKVMSAQTAEELIQSLQESGCQVNASFCSYHKTWPDRPTLPENKAFILELKYAGNSFQGKWKEVRQAMETIGVDAYPVSALDDIAWLFNLRGSDVDFNPVVSCFALVEKEVCSLFIHPHKIDQKTRTYLQENKVNILGYDEFYPRLQQLKKETRVLVDMARINEYIYKSIPLNCVKVESLSPITRLKSIKNATEIEGYQKAMVKDGVAMVKCWMWMEDALCRGIEFDEIDVADQLVACRKSDPHYVGESFSPIVGYNSNGAIVHYSATPESRTIIKNNGFLLIDTGGQWFEGTTDITRSFSLYDNDTPDEYKQDYAAVLKGTIGLSECVFPEHIRGCLIDAFARQHIWKRGCQYGHGTSHGVGHFLNVHEGPQSIRMEENPVCIQAGMVMSDEPGIYRTGLYGLRIENMIVCREKFETDFGKFLGFDTLTLFPLDLKAINPAYYSQEEIDWINRYHQRVYDALSPFLTEKEQSWLKEKTASI